MIMGKRTEHSNASLVMYDYMKAYMRYSLILTKKYTPYYTFGKVWPTKKILLVLGCQHILILALDFFITVAPIWCPYLARSFEKISEKGFDSFLDQSISFIIPRYMRGWWWLFKLRFFDTYERITLQSKCKDS